MTEDRELLTGSVRLESGRSVLTVVGEIDVASVAVFRGLLDQAMSTSTSMSGVTVDLSGVVFCDARGLTVLVAAAHRVRDRGVRLEVRGAPARTVRLFEVMGLMHLLGVEAPATGSVVLGGLAQAAMVPHTRDVLDAALKLVVTMAQAVVVGADGVSITLPRNGRLGTVAASNDVVLEMDHDQYDTGEGPCLDAATQGERFQIEALREESRWPAFVPRAQARGIHSILSTPLVTADRPIGALNVYSRTERAFAAHEKQWTDQFAAEASVVVSSAALGESVELINEQLRQALLSREVITLAQGVLMQRDGLSQARAYAALTDRSRETGQPLRKVCAELLGARDDSSAMGGPADGSGHGHLER